MGLLLKAQRVLKMMSTPLPDETIPRMIQPAGFPIQAAGLFRKGDIWLGATIADTHVGRGSQFDLHVACRNYSTAAIRSVGVKLLEHMRWKVDNNWDGHKDAEIEAFHENVNLPALTEEHNTRGSDSDASNQIHNDLVSGLNKTTLIIPPRARDSYVGQLVQVSHSISIHCRQALE